MVKQNKQIMEGVVMDSKLFFRIVLKPEPEGGYTVLVPQGCITYGDTVEDAVKMAEDAIVAYLESMKKWWGNRR